MFRIVWVLIRALVSAFRSRHQLVLENLALRQQLAAFMARRARPRIRATDRALSGSGPATLGAVGRRAGHREAGHRRPMAPGRLPAVLEMDLAPRLPTRAATRRCRSPRPHPARWPSENSWGAPRIHGELLMLGFDVSERTISRYLRGLHRRPEARQSWLTFLRNHREVIAAMDLFVVFTVSFRLLYVLFVVRHGRRRIVHFNVTEHPTAAWVVQQLREAFPYDSAPRHLIFDRDSIFATEVVAAIRAMGIRPTRTAYRSPWQNGTAERWVGCCRQELLDHVVVAGRARTCVACCASTSRTITRIGRTAGSTSARRCGSTRRTHAVGGREGHRRCLASAGCIIATSGEKRRRSPPSIPYPGCRSARAPPALTDRVETIIGKRGGSIASSAFAGRLKMRRSGAELGGGVGGRPVPARATPRSP